MSDQVIYLDNNATTAVDPDVVRLMMPYLKDLYFNPSSAYAQSHLTKKAMETSRAQITEILGARDSSEIVFTGCASESNNMAIKGVLQANPERKHIITTAVEHPSVYELCKDLQRQGYEVTYLSVNDNGELNVKELIESIRSDTALVSIMHANNETGVIFPIEKYSRIVKETDEKVVFHTDATQSACKIPIDLSASMSHVDLLTFSGHKIHAPKGVGVLYFRKGTQCRPMLVGGHQERGRRAGTENVPYIVGLAKACQNAAKHMGEGSKLIQKKRDALENYLRKTVPAVIVNGEKAPRLVTTSNISFQGIEGEAILYAMNEHGICASTGSACSSGSLAPSHVLQAMKIPFTFAHGSVRFSFSRFNTDSEVEKVKEVVPDLVARIRKLSPYWDNKTNTPIDEI